MCTRHVSFIPMAPGLRPQQRMYEVATLPQLPKGLDPKIEIDEPLLPNPPKTLTRKLTYLFSVEWTWCVFALLPFSQIRSAIKAAGPPPSGP
jgi:hypothetical protein